MSVAAGAPIGTPVQRLRGRLVTGASWLVARLPDPILDALADVAGELWYRADPARAARARRNLGRVCERLAAEGRGSLRARRAAGDPAALERLVRAASRQHARYYVEVLRTAGAGREWIHGRIEMEDPASADAAFATVGPMIVIGIHLGPLEVPAIYLADRLQRPTVVPMETIGDPVLQAWFERTRSLVGLRIVPIPAARAALNEVLAAGGIAGLVADRDIAGGGVEVPFFGRPAPLPIGGALAAVESGAPAWVMGARRLPGGRYAARVIRIPTPGEGRLRERVVAFLTAQAAAYEELIAAAPEQWWSAFFPIWKDLEAGA